MQKLGKLAVAGAATLAALGLVAVGGGAARAATMPAVTGCQITDPAAGTAPTCQSYTATVLNPTSVTITIDGNYIADVPGATQTVIYELQCRVNGKTPSFETGTFSATGTQPLTKTVNLQSFAGSPQPNWCKVYVDTQGDTAPTAVQSTGMLFGAYATATTAVPGAIWMPAGKTSSGASAGTCVDDAGNGNAGSKIQAYQCNSGLAQVWVQTSGGQLVHNGVCLTQVSTKATLAKCSSTNNAQKWTVNGTGGKFATIVNKSTHQCLTAPSPKNATQLTVAKCTNAYTQRWTGPTKSPA